MNRAQAHDILEALLDLLEERDPSPYYTQHDSPLGPKRHVRLVRDGKIPGFKPAGGRDVYAKREDVHAYIERHPVKAKPPRRLHLATSQDSPERAVERLLG